MNSKVLHLNVKVDSSLIELLEYNSVQGVLGVKYKRGKHKGRIKEYSDVSQELFFEILNANSVGKKILELFHSQTVSSF